MPVDSANTDSLAGRLATLNPRSVTLQGSTRLARLVSAVAHVSSNNSLRSCTEHQVGAVLGQRLGLAGTVDLDHHGEAARPARGHPGQRPQTAADSGP